MHYCRGTSFQAKYASQGFPSVREDVPFIPGLFGFVTQLLEPRKVPTPIQGAVTTDTHTHTQCLLWARLHSAHLQMQTRLIFPTISARPSHYPQWLEEEAEAGKGLIACGRCSHCQSTVETRHKTSWLAFKTSIWEWGAGSLGCFITSEPCPLRSSTWQFLLSFVLSPNQ